MIILFFCFFFYIVAEKPLGGSFNKCMYVYVCICMYVIIRRNGDLCFGGYVSLSDLFFRCMSTVY